MLAAALAASVAGLAGGPAYASAGSRPVLSVGGEVTTAASYTVAQLAALPQTTATVTVGGRQVTEQLTGGRPLQLSLNEDGVALAQPRLVTDGDVKGGRYVSGVVDIYVGTGPAR